MNPTTRSHELFERALQAMPGGVSSPVRAFRAVGGTPLFVDRAEGAHLTDVDGNTYLDFVMSWGPLILGHANPAMTLRVYAHAFAAADQAVAAGLGEILKRDDK